MKKTIKNFATLLLATIMISGFIPLLSMTGLNLPEFDLFSVKAEAYTHGGYTYTLDLQDNATITECNFVIPENFVIPSELDGHPVIGIGYSVFHHRPIKTLTLPDTVTTIGGKAFWECDNLTTINFGKGIAYIGNSAFQSCDNLASVGIPKSVENIGEDAFRDCHKINMFSVDPGNSNYLSDEYGVLFNKDGNKLIQYPTGNQRSEYNVPDSVTTICKYSFSLSDNLKKIFIGKNVTNIEANAFSGCGNLTTIKFGDNVKTIGEFAFNECKNLSEIILPEGLTTIGQWAFNGCQKITEISLPDSVTVMENTVFGKCNSLKTVNIGKGLKKIGKQIFYDCTKLSFISVSSDNQYFSNDKSGVLFDKDQRTLIHYPVNIREVSYTVPVTTLTIGEEAFMGCNLVSINLGYYLETIESSAFSNCINLAEITFAPDIKEIGVCAFEECDALVGVKLPDGLTKIGFYAFQYCDNLKYVHIPSSVTDIGFNIFTSDMSAYICSDTENCHAKEYADNQNYKFELCNGNHTVYKNAIRTPSSQNIKYGDSIILHVDTALIPEGGYVIWTANNENFSFSIDTGSTCIITPSSSGTTIFTATIFNADGSKVFVDELEMTSKAGFFNKILAFFKKIFGLTKVIPE